MLTHIGNITHEFASSRVYYREGPPKGLIEKLLNMSRKSHAAGDASPPTSYSESPQKGELGSPPKRRRRQVVDNALNSTADVNVAQTDVEQVEHVCNQKRD
jgi:hypothetical protein